MLTMFYSLITKGEEKMITTIGLLVSLALFLIVSGVWGIIMVVRNLGAGSALIAVGGTGLIATALILSLGTRLSASKSIKKPVLSTIIVFALFFVAICLFEGILYDIHLLISSF
jgi:hypothetical protein